jgi:ubiquinone/menaquinone biosynthesis C-methylase UbiE
MSNHEPHGHDEHHGNHEDANHEHANHEESKHGHAHGPATEADWARWAGDAELEGEVLLDFVRDAADRLRPLLPPSEPLRIFDVGAGPAVASCEFARLFPNSDVIAFDSSQGMLQRADQRIKAHGLTDRVTTAVGDLSEGFGTEGVADLIWASMSLHHVGDEIAALRLLQASLSSQGVLAIVEIADPLCFLPDDVGIGSVGLRDRIASASAKWFREMRQGLESAVESKDLAWMVASAGLTILDDRVAKVRLNPPLSADARNLVAVLLRRSRHIAELRLDADDLGTIDALLDPLNPKSVTHRDDLFIEAFRRVIFAR